MANNGILPAESNRDPLVCYVKVLSRNKSIINIIQYVGNRGMYVLPIYLFNSYVVN